MSLQPNPGRLRPASSSLTELIARVAQRDERALGELYDATAAWVHGLALRVLGDAAAAEDEECYVLNGDLSVEDQMLSAGDYQFAPQGSIHGVQRTKHGCTLLVVSSRHDEILTA